MGSVWTKGKLALLPDDHVPVACNCLGTINFFGSRLSARFIDVSSGTGEYKLFSLFQNTDMNTVTQMLIW